MLPLGRHLLVYFLLLVLLSVCKSQSSGLHPTNSQNQVLQTANTKSIAHGFFLVNDDRDKVASDHLLVIKANVATVTTGGTKIGRLQVYTDSQADFFRWQVCPHSGSAKCLEGRSFLTNVYWGVLPGGGYTVVVRACANANHTLHGQEGCGPLYPIEWYQAPSPDSEAALLIDEIRTYEAALIEISLTLEEVFAQFQSDLALCQARAKKLHQTFTNAPDSQQLWEIIRIQLQNLMNLGPDYLAMTVVGINGSETDQAVVAAKVDPSDPTPVPDDGFGTDSYLPEGFSLTASESVNQGKEALRASIVRYYEHGPLVADLPVEQALFASTGGNGGLGLTNEIETSVISDRDDGLSGWRLGTKAASLLLSGWGGLLDQEVATEMAGYRLVSAFFNIKRDDYVCPAFNKAIDSLTPLKVLAKKQSDRLRQLKDTLATLNTVKP